MRRLTSLTAKIAISAALLYLALTRVDLGTIGTRLQQAEISWLIVLVLALAAQIVLGALRWQYIGQHCDAQIPLRSALRFMLIGSFFNQTLPSSIGGDAARIWLVSRAGAGWKAAAYSVIVDRFIGLAVLAAFVIVCLPWLLQLVREPLGRAGVLLFNGAAIAATISFLILGRVRWHWLNRFWITRQITGTAAVALKIVSNWSNAFFVVRLSVAIHLLSIAAIWSAAQSIAAPLEFWQALLLVPPVILVSAVPISIAGWGVREGAMMVVFAYAGLLNSDGLVVSILYGAAQFSVGAVGGLVWILGSEQRIGAAEAND